MENNWLNKDLPPDANPYKQHVMEDYPLLDMKYFTPSIEDFVYGYEYETDAHRWTPLPDGKWLSEENWYKSVHKEPFMSGTSISSNLKLGLIRVPYLTKEQIESFGFVLKAKSIDHWFQIAEDKRFDTDLQNFCGYKAYNVFLNYGFHDYRLKIKADFSGGSDFDKAETLFDGECKCINGLRQILKQIHITPFYES